MLIGIANWKVGLNPGFNKENKEVAISKALAKNAKKFRLCEKLLIGYPIFSTAIQTRDSKSKQ